MPNLISKEVQDSIAWDRYESHIPLFRRGKLPFLWSPRIGMNAISAPAGWYQWTGLGLVYLGESILEAD